MFITGNHIKVIVNEEQDNLVKQAVKLSNNLQYCTKMFENINGDFKLSELFKIPNTSINISTMFGNSSIEELPVGFTLNVQSTNKYCQSAFKDCYNLKYLPSSFELKQNSLCNNMFSGSGLQSIILTIPKLNDMKSMCENCTNLTEVIFTFANDFTLGRNGFQNLFSGCTSLTSIVFYGLENIASQTIDVNNLFKNCSSLTTFPKLWQFNNITWINTSTAFTGCNQILDQIPQEWGGTNTDETTTT